MSNDYLANHLFVPFAQGDHVEPGTGLGLPLLKRTAESIGGSVQVESDESEGTTVKVVLPVYMHQLDIGERMSELSVQDADHAVVHAQLYSSTKQSDEPRDARSRDLLQSSLAKTLRRVGTQLDPWNPTSQPDMIIVLQEDVLEMVDAIGDREGLRWLILCRDTKPPSVPNLGSATRPKSATVTGPILPSKVQSAVKALFPDKFDAAGDQLPVINLVEASDGPAAAIAVQSPSAERDNADKLDDAVRNVPDNEPQAGKESKTPSGNGEAAPLSEPARTPSKPSMLLVDDNAINLKVLVSTNCRICTLRCLTDK